MPSPTPLPDLETREDIDCQVADFYTRVRADELLAPVFNDIAAVDWDAHAPKIADFWEKGSERATTTAIRCKLIYF